MEKRCKYIMTLLMIFMVLLIICQTEENRTTKQLYLIPYNLANGPIVPHLPYWTPYYYPMPLGYSSQYGQSFIDNTQFVKNQIVDFNSTSPIERNPEEISGRQRPFLTFLQNLFFGGAPTSCPSCPSCPANKPCVPCAVSASADTPGSFTKCEANGVSSASSGTISFSGLLTTTPCNYVIAVQDPTAAIKVVCSTLTLGVGITATTQSMPDTGTALSLSNLIPTPPTLSNFIAIKMTNAVTTGDGGSVSCSWDLWPKTSEFKSFIACETNAFTSANTGTITLSGLDNNAKCSYSIGIRIPIAGVRVSCETVDLNTGSVVIRRVRKIPYQLVSTSLSTLNAAGSVPPAANPIPSGWNLIRIIVTSEKANGAVTCTWNLGSTDALVPAIETCENDFFTAATSGTITVSANTLNAAMTCKYNLASPNSAATIKVKCKTKSLDGDDGTKGDVTAIFSSESSVSVTADGVTSPSNYVTIKVDNKKAGGSVDCSWLTIIPS